MRITFKQLVGLGLLAVSSLAAVALPGALRMRAGDPSDAAPLVNAAPPAPAPGAATNCPPFSLGGVNLARNPSFETVGPNGSSTLWLPGQPTPPLRRRCTG